MARQVHVVPHTHWDREWYRTYPTFRMQLVELLDGLLPTLEADHRYAHFQLDGQMAVVDDYLEIRPEQRDLIVALNRAGRLTMGPWYTLPDEFLVSGETHIRNLRLGLARAEEFGGAMPVGYLPDMFGHVAQMPQILAGFGFGDAVVWRGVPAAIDAPAFWWEAPDGTRIRAEYLPDGYSNGARLPDDGPALVDQVMAFRAAQGNRVGDAVLWMNGTDHQLPDPRLVQVVREANAAQTLDHFEITSLAAHLETAPRDGLPTWQGELRSGARSNVLMGVASCRVDVKQAAARAERWLERVAEPLSACWLPADAWPGAFFDVAWQGMVRNAAHDSICGCSADDVNHAVLHRYREATQVAVALTERALVRALAAAGEPAIVVNPTARDRSGLVTAVVPGDIAPPHTQQLSVRPQHQRSDALTRRAAVAVVMRAAMEDPRVSRATLSLEGHPGAANDTDGGPGRWVATLTADRGPKAIDATELREQLEALAREDPEAIMHLDVVRPSATQEVLLHSAAVPGHGWRGLAPDDLGDHAVRVDGYGLTNGLVTVEGDTSDGTFSINGISGFGRLVDDGDAGDTYNWSPPAEQGVIQRPERVEVSVTEAGPVRGRIEIVGHYTWPSHVADGRRVGAEPVAIVTEVELRAGEDLVRVSVSLNNPSRDHRLRIHLPLPAPAQQSEAECAFGVVTRGLVAEGGPNEAGLPTFPSRRFVAAGGLLMVHDGLTEYELVDIDQSNSASGTAPVAHELAVTLLRSVGTISRGPMTMRALPAGPSTPTPAAQMIGAHHAELVLHLGGRNPYEVADEAFTPLLTAHFPGLGGLGNPQRHGRALEITGAEVTALTVRSDGHQELRVVNPTSGRTTLTVVGRTGVITDLRGESTGQRFSGRLSVNPWQIVTISLDPPAE